MDTVIHRHWFKLILFQADMNDKASLQKAMEGSAAVYALTNYWEKMDADLELQQGKNLADAAKVSTHVAVLVF